MARPGARDQIPATISWVDSAGIMERMDRALTHERLLAALSYDPGTGIFRWRERPSNRVKIGAVAGSVDKRRRYRKISVDGEAFYAHQLAWFYVHRMWAARDIDHINGDPDDNRIANLRDVDRQTNMENFRRVRRKTKAGLLGVTIDKGKFAAYISTQGRTFGLGRFDTAKEAHQAYVEAKRKLHKGNTL